MAINTKYIWMNGEFVPREQAVVPFLNNTLHYGVGFFEGIRSYRTTKGAAVFRLTDHVDRLFDSLKIGGFTHIPFTREEISEAIKETLRVNELTDAYIRPLVYYQDDVMGMSIDNGELKVGIAAWEWPSIYSDEVLQNGLHAGISSFARIHHNSLLVKAKACGNYVNSIYANHQAKLQGYNETILLDQYGFVSECSGENLLVVSKGKVYSPSYATMLGGITRDSVVTLLSDLKIDVIEQPIARDMLYIADEVFLTGTAAEVVGISQIDNRIIGSGRVGPLSAEMRKLYIENARGEGAHSAEWCELI